VALRLKNRGITRVHPLDGGLNRWRELSFPVDPLAVPAGATPVTTQP
jgi:rhodanese-related sulfurtransferase